MKPASVGLPRDLERNIPRRGIRARKKDMAQRNKINDSKLTRHATPEPAANAVSILAHAPYSFEIGGFDNVIA